MQRFKIVFSYLGKTNYEILEACSSKEAIDKVCDKFDIGYDCIIGVEEK